MKKVNDVAWTRADSCCKLFIIFYFVNENLNKQTFLLPFLE